MDYHHPYLVYSPTHIKLLLVYVQDILFLTVFFLSYLHTYSHHLVPKYSAYVHIHFLLFLYVFIHLFWNHFIDLNVTIIFIMIINIICNILEEVLIFMVNKSIKKVNIIEELKNMIMNINNLKEVKLIL